MTKTDQQARTKERRAYDERRMEDRRGGERRAGERRLESCPSCHGILNAKGYCYHCEARIVKILP